MSEPPLVNGLQPSIGPSTGGKELKIRGNNLGISQADVLEITIGGVPVREFEWCTPSKIRCVTPRADPGVTTADVIVSTSSGGQGSCTVAYTYEQVEQPQEDVKKTVDLLTESDVWVEEEEDVSKQGGMAPAASADRDPLQLGRSSTTVRALMKDTRGKGAVAAAFGDLRRRHPDGSGTLSDPQFVPAWCLLERYRDLPIQDLFRGLGNLKRLQKSRDKTLHKLLLANASTFVSCYEASHRLRDAILTHKRSTSAKDITRAVARKCSIAHDSTTAVYTESLQRQQQASLNRACISMLSSSRYQFLFSLPQTIEENAANNNWSQILLDYRKACTLFADEHTPGYEQIQARLKQLASEVTSKLRHKLEELPKPLPQQLNLFSHLEQLEPEKASEHRRSIMANQRDFIQQQLVSQLDELNARLAAAHEAEEAKKHGRATSSRSVGSSRSKRRWSTIRTALVMSSGTPRRRGSSFSMAFAAWKTSNDAYTSEEMQAARLQTSSRDPSPTRRLEQQHERYERLAKTRQEELDKDPRLAFLETSSSLVAEQVSNLWHLGSETSAPAGSAVTPAKTRRTRRRSSVRHALAGDVPAAGPDAGTTWTSPNADTEDMCSSLIEDFSSMIRQHFLEPHKSQHALPPSPSPKQSRRQSLGHKDSALRHALPKAAAALRSCHRTMQVAGVPRSALATLEDLLADLHRDAVGILFEQAYKEIRNVVKSEDWRPEEHGSRTSLPIKFEAIVTAVLQALQDFSSGPSSYQADLEDADTEAMYCRAFSEFIEALADLVSDKDNEKLSQQRIAVRRSSEIAIMDRPLRLEVDEDRLIRLLCAVSNVTFTRDIVASRLVVLFDSLRLELGPAYQTVLDDLTVLQNSAIDEVVAMQREYFESLLDPASLSDMVGVSEGVRVYVRELVHHFVLLHSRLLSHCSRFVSRILSQLLSQMASMFADAAARALDGAHFDLLSQIAFEAECLRSLLRSLDPTPSAWLALHSTLSSCSKRLVRRRSRASRSSSLAKRRSTTGSTSSRGGRQLPTPGASRKASDDSTGGTERDADTGAVLSEPASATSNDGSSFLSFFAKGDSVVHTEADVSAFLDRNAFVAASLSQEAEVLSDSDVEV